MRAVAATALGLMLLPLGASFANPGEELVACRSQKQGGNQITLRGDRWLRIGVPKFDAGEGPAKLAAFAPAPHRPNALFVTNGQVVKLSADAGCTWETIYRGNNLRAPLPGYVPDVLTQLVAPTDTSLWVSSYDDVDGVPHPHVYVGRDVGVDGKSPTFGQLDVGLPTYGRPVSLAVSSLGLGEAYLLLDELPDPQQGASTSPTRHLYTTYTPDSPPEVGALTGRAWKELSLPAGFGPVDGVTRQDSHLIWIWSGQHYAYAEHVDTAPIAWHEGTAAGRIVAIDVDAAGQVSVVAQGVQGAVLAQPNSQGKLVQVIGVPITPALVAHGSRQGVFAVSGIGGTYGLDHRLHRWVDITPRGGPVFRQLDFATGTTTRVLLALAPDALWRWDTFRDETFREPPAPPAGTGDPDSVQLPTSRLTAPLLTPVRRVVTVTPGAIHDVPVSFRVPPTPTPLDVYFLVDTTYSMGPAIRGLRRAINTIAGNIRAQLGVNACFGVGDVKDLGADSPYVFNTLLPVSPCDTAPGLPRVSQAVSRLTEVGGGDTPEAQTVALSQAVTGTGQTYVPVPAGQQATFRHGAFKVIVYISDAPSHQGNGYPTVQETIQTLNVADVKVVSIAVNDGGGDLNGAKALMDTIARGTNSLSPPAGVDCNGDGGGYYGDLGPGVPLVCEISVTSSSDGSGRIVNIGPAILGLLLAVKDPGTIEVRVEDPSSVLRAPIRGRTSDIRDLKYETGLSFTLPVGCAAAQLGRDLTVSLIPLVRSREVGLRGDVLVQCRARSSPPLRQLLIPPAFRVPQGGRPPVAIAPPAPPGPANAPGQPVSNINVNAGMAQNEEEQAQLATATQEETETSEDLAMSALSATERDKVGVCFVLSAATLLTGACWQVSKQRQAVRAQPDHA